PEVLPELDEAEARLLLDELADDLAAAVARAVVDEDELEAVLLTELTGNLREPLDELRKDLLFVEDRDRDAHQRTLLQARLGARAVRHRRAPSYASEGGHVKAGCTLVRCAWLGRSLRWRPCPRHLDRSKVPCCAVPNRPACSDYGFATRITAAPT